MANRKNKAYTDDEKALVEYLREKLKNAGVQKYPRDWHLKQLSFAHIMLTGENSPTLPQWKACIDWLFQNEFWKDKVDHLARVESLWTKYVLQGKKNTGNNPAAQDNDARKRAFIRSLYL